MKNISPLTSIIIPAYNEEKNITKVIRNISRLKTKYHLEIIVVDDGSRDKTVQVAKKAGADSVISYKKNKGKGGAFRVGIDAAKGDYIVQIDADHQFQPDEIPLFIKALDEGYDVVCGTRFNKGSIEKGSVSKVNLFGNWLMSVVTTFFSGIKSTDIMAGFKGFTKDAAKQLNLVTPHFGYEAEIVVKAGKLGLKVKEIPITYTKRTFGSSSVHAIKDGIRVSYTIAKMYLTFPGPPPGYGVVGKRILTVLIPIWLFIILPVFTYLTNKTVSVNTLFETQYVLAFLLFFAIKQFTGSRFSALVASAFFALSPVVYPKYPLLGFSWYGPFIFWFALVGFTLIFFQDRKKEFFRKSFFLGIFFNACLLLLQDQTGLTSQWISLNLLLFGLLISRYFWNIERKFAQSIIYFSIFILIGIMIKSVLLNAIGVALLVGTVTASIFLETISFRVNKSPLFSSQRLVRIFLLFFLLVGVISVKILRAIISL